MSRHRCRRRTRSSVSNPYPFGRACTRVLLPQASLASTVSIKACLRFARQKELTCEPALETATQKMMDSPENREKLKSPAEISTLKIENGELRATYH
jgi:hypothetical protein